MLISYSYCVPTYTCGYLLDLQLPLRVLCTLLLSDSKYGSSPCHPSCTHCLPSTHTTLLPSTHQPSFPPPPPPPPNVRKGFPIVYLCIHMVVYVCCSCTLSDVRCRVLIWLHIYEEKLAVMACLSYLCQQIEYHADTCVSSILLIVNVVIQNLDGP